MVCSSFLLCRDVALLILPERPARLSLGFGPLPSPPAPPPQGGRGVDPKLSPIITSPLAGEGGAQAPGEGWSFPPLRETATAPRLKLCPFAKALRDMGSGARLRLDDRFERRFEHAESFLELVVRDNERHQQPDDVAVAPRRKHDQAVLIAVSHDLFGLLVGGFARFLRAHQFNRLHGAEASYVADKLPALLPLEGASAEPVAEEVRAPVEVHADSGGVLESLLEQVEYAERRFASQGIPAERAAERADYGDIHQLGAARDRRERQSSAERLRRHQEVRLDAVARRSEQTARSPHAALHFIGDEQDPVPAADVLKDGQEFRRRRDKAAFT